MADELDLGEIAKAVKPDEYPLVEVDITPFLEVPEGRKVVLKWKEPSVRSVYLVSNDTDTLMKANPAWPLKLAAEVAMMAACHQSPSTGGKDKGSFYSDLANGENRNLWHYLSLAMKDHFPHLVTEGDAVFLQQMLVERASISPASAPVISGDDTPTN